MARARSPRSGAAVLILDEEEENCLAISRGKDSSDWNLPGGHVEEGESLHQTAVRELYEETGVMVTPSNLKLVYKHKTAHVFLASDFFRWPPTLRSDPFEGYVTWKPLRTLCRSSSTFHEHHRRLFSQLDLR